MDITPYQHAIGRTEVSIDTISPVPARGLAGALDLDPDLMFDGAELPPLWLWLYFLPSPRASDTGPDGHARRGKFLPDIPLPRRMWAGSRIEFFAPAKIGGELTKVSTIAKISGKTGRTGDMAFVTVRHAWSRGGASLMEEEQDIVFLPMPDHYAPPAPIPAPEADWQTPVPVDPVLLFRFSALTYNAHRIHYDAAYASDVEKYPGLVVHGPLQAIWLMDEARKRNPDREVRRFSFRGVHPLFSHDRVTVCGRTNEGGLDLCTVNSAGAQCMQASLSWA
ncbi:MaoC family dehydratase N-terminal domain-containing protein [Hyphomonas sp. WL0036]|uniref:FAS1-like dehydratase domain-containing protein n=1 Tax=Hyphomonas sediminis TaxID=2866160 RepID=UPI001C805E71|nr:MaoC family dehydratase N-terminal domain-containing protein [Hyphomonas sediminis]MBY9067253.1 MaoC family dehydratase N-terminal domain-containing protein [Hyphomonas sediminis]